MDIKVFTEMLKDKHFPDYKKLKYKYDADFNSFLKALEELYYKPLPLYDFDGNNIVFTEALNAVNQNTVKLLLQTQDTHYGIKAAGTVLKRPLFAVTASKSLARRKHCFIFLYRQRLDILKLRGYNFFTAPNPPLAVKR